MRLFGQGKLDVPSGDVDGEVRKIIDDAAEKHAQLVVDDPAAESAAASAVVEKIVRAGRDGGSVSGEQKRKQAGGRSQGGAHGAG